MQAASNLDDLTAEVLRLKQQGIGSVAELELFGTGRHRDNEVPWTRAEIEAIHRNFAELSTGAEPPLPVVIGLDHVKGGPAVGRVSKLWLKPGGVIAVRFDDIPRLYAEAIDQGLWFRVSAEIEAEPPFGLPGSGPTLVGVTLLGRQRPQLKWTSHLQNLVRYSERSGRVAPVRRRFWSQRSGSRTRLFSEAVMDRATLEDQLKSAGFTDAQIEALKALDDEAFAAFANATLAQMAGVGAPPEGAAAEGGAMMEGMTREQMIEAIVAADPAQDRAALEAMDDAALAELLKSIAPDAFAEHAQAATAPLTSTPIGAAMPTIPAVPPPAGLTPAMTAQFAEFQRASNRVLQTQLATLQRATAATRSEAAAVRRYAETRERDRLEAEIDAVVDAALGRGALPPSEDDDKNPRLPPLRKRLRNLIGIRTTAHSYSEGGKTVRLTPLEVELERIKALPAHKYAERIAARVGGSPLKALADQVVAETKAREAARHTSSAIPLRQRLGMFAPRHQR